MDSARKLKFFFSILIFPGLFLSAFTAQPRLPAAFQGTPYSGSGKILMDLPANPDESLRSLPPQQLQEAKTDVIQNTGGTSGAGLSPVIEERAESRDLLAFQEFTRQVANGQADMIRGIYSPDGFALRVIQQPSGDPAYVSGIEGVATQFSQAAQMNVIGLLAHNFASGRHFSILQPGSLIRVIRGDGSVEEYSVTGIHRYQALQPESPTTNFVDLDTGEVLSAQQTFFKVYSGDHHLTLQTCIAQGSNISWGRLFIIAYPTGKAPVESIP